MQVALMCEGDECRPADQIVRDSLGNHSGIARLPSSTLSEPGPNTFGELRQGKGELRCCGRVEIQGCGDCWEVGGTECTGRLSQHGYRPVGITAEGKPKGVGLVFPRPYWLGI